MRMKVALLAFFLPLMGLCLFAPVSASAHRQTPPPNLTIQIGGISPDRECSTLNFNGTFTVTDFFVDQNGQLRANGKLVGPVTTPSACGAQVVANINDFVFNGLPITNVSGNCQTLNITIGNTTFPLPSLKRVLQLGTGTLTLTSREVHHKLCSLASGKLSPQQEAKKLNKLIQAPSGHL